MKNWVRLFLVFLVVATHAVVGQTNSKTEEQELLRLTNELRTNPQMFLKKYVRPYLIEKQKDTIDNEYTSSLLKELNTQAPAPALALETVLNKKAREFAKDMGSTGETGHSSKNLGEFSERLKQFKYKYLAENCSYGYERAIDILMQLLIDDGVDSKGHRKNLLNPVYKNIGIAIEPHRIWSWNCVMDFSN